MDLLSSSRPFSDPGTLFGGLKARVAEIQATQADLFRAAQQQQQTLQSGRALSGAQVTNEHTQEETIRQDATSEVVQEVVLEPPDLEARHVPAGFPFNFLPQVLTQLRASEFLARSVLNLNQQQHAGQVGFASGVDFSGQPSTVTNHLVQDETTVQQAVSSVINHATLQREAAEEQAARFQEVQVQVEGNRVQAGSLAVQEQGGGAGAASSQVGRADGGVVTNTLEQRASAEQRQEVRLENTLDLREEEPPDVLSPRSQSVEVTIEGPHVENYSSVVQSQSLVQLAEGGVDENGNPTENGGTVHNEAHQSANYTENTVAESKLTVLV